MNASGGYILNGGEVEMTFLHDEDEESEQAIQFQHAKVHMPIMSVK